MYVFYHLFFIIILFYPKRIVTYCLFNAHVEIAICYFKIELQDNMHVISERKYVDLQIPSSR